MKNWVRYLLLGACSLVFAGCDDVVSGTMATMELPTAGGTAGAGVGGTSGGTEGGAGGDGSGGSPIGSAGTSSAGAGGGISSGGNSNLPAADLSSCPDLATACVSAVSSEPLPGRPIISDPALAVDHERVTVGQIYDQFVTACGRCHGPTRAPDEGSNGGWIPSANSFATDEQSGDDALSRVMSEDPGQVMPPRTPASRRHNVAVDTFALMLQDWLEAGKSPDGYLREVAVSGGDPSLYRYPAGLRDKFTNIGNCIPSPALVNCDKGGRAEAMDKKFAAIKTFADLPKRLEETDMTTFDSALLAAEGVLSFAPGYTLYSDHAKKMRYIRVPRGTAVRYDEDLHDFVIPNNTRFYKTFLKAVKDASGNTVYRKIETRIIIVRPDEINERGQPVPTAVFGSYRWSLDESRAVLIETPYRDGKPFKDTLLPYVTDEQKARELGFDPNTDDGVIGATQVVLDGPLADLHITRDYAVPGSDRCIQCHMGSMTATTASDGVATTDPFRGAFILGFSPFHADRRPWKDGGTFDDPQPLTNYGPDELTQLKRFIDYGLVEDIEPGQVKLEQPQVSVAIAPVVEGDAGAPPPSAEPKPRTHRSPEELKAQGYMMGNCAFCHNPRGFPTVQNPELRDRLNFYPRAGGGIFEFPISRTSPRTFRGSSFTTQMPYITPSLIDHSNTKPDEYGKYPGVVRVSDLATGKSGDILFLAPWRSLLYRNVSTPFTYSNDSALHPHMPLNVPGFDCRTPQIMAEWMLSIPARLKNDRTTYSIFEEKLVENPAGPPTRRLILPAGGVKEDFTLDQPWEEVPRGDSDHAAAEQAAKGRLEAYRSDTIQIEDGTTYGYVSRRNFCPDDSNTRAPEMTRSVRPATQPDDVPIIVGFDHVAFAEKLTGTQGTLFIDGEPDRAHWIDRDMSDPQDEQYVPRRQDWRARLSDPALAVPPFCPKDGSVTSGCIPDMSIYPPDSPDRRNGLSAMKPVIEQAKRVFDLQRNLSISDEFRQFALAELPYGVWDGRVTKTAPGEEARCELALSKSTTVGQLKASKLPPLWLETTKVKPDDSDLVYSPLPGEILFEQICSNCHGVEANSQSLLANTILEMTGGLTRVANLRDGLFGEGGHRRAEADPSVRFLDDDEAARYVVWMGLGGTTATIPPAVLSRVGKTRALGEERPGAGTAQPTANMLSNAVTFCEGTLTTTGISDPFVRGGANNFIWGSLISQNGDAELWLKLCSFENPRPVFTITAKMTGGEGTILTLAPGTSYFPVDQDGRRLVPADTVMGNERGLTEKGLNASNLYPWCFDTPQGFPLDKLAAKMRTEVDELPLCPPALLAKLGSVAVQDVTMQTEAAKRWAVRGAMNVGLAVFLYLDAKSRNEVQQKPAYNACAVGGAGN